MHRLLLSAILFVSVSAQGHGISHERAHELVTMLYHSALFREPDPAGFSACLDSVLKGGHPALVNAATAFGRSAEYHGVVRRHYAPQAVLQNIYRRMLGRDVDFEASFTWLPYLRNGRADVVLRGIVASDEFYRLHIVP